jgi:hypothetical protein
MADYVLDKGFPVLPTYNSSNAAGVTYYRVVKWSSTGIDLCTDATATTAVLGVVMENVDQVKVATGKVNADVRLLGVAPVFVNATPGTINLGTRVMCGNAGGVIAAATTGSKVLGVCVGLTAANQTAAAGDIIYVALTPGVLF